MNINIGQVLANRSFLSPDLEAFVGAGYRYDFKQVNARVNQMAGYLAQQNIVQGDRVAVLCKNNQHFVTAMYAAAKIGAILLPLNWRLQPPELAYILSDSGASVLLYDVEFSEVAEQMKQEIKISSFVQVGGQGPDLEFEAALAGNSAAEPQIIGGGDDPAIIMYTSGTTGKPKGAILSHNNLLWASIGLSHTIDWQHQDRFLSVAPLFHIGGLAPIVTNIHKGCTTVFMPNFDPAKVWETIVSERINNLMSVPMMLAFMLKIPGVDQLDLSSLRTICCGGSAVPENLIMAYHKLGLKVQQVYGITEYSGAVTFWTYDMGLEKCNSMGKPMFHGDLKIVDPDSGKEMPAGEAGEIYCGGPQVFKGYWNNPGATDKVLVDGWYRSGDVGRKDEDGFVYVVDRLKDMIISGGENIYSAELEMVIGKHPDVAEVAVIGVPDSKWGEMPRAYVAKKPGSELTEEAIIEFCRSNLAKYKCVKEVTFVDALPRNAVGKILKTVIKTNI